MSKVCDKGKKSACLAHKEQKRVPDFVGEEVKKGILQLAEEKSSTSRQILSTGFGFGNVVLYQDEVEAFG